MASRTAIRDGGGRSDHPASGLIFEYVMRCWRRGQADVDLDDLALAHFLGHLRRVQVELPIPFAQLIDRPVALAQQRIVDADLVVPDCHVLVEALLNPLDVSVDDLSRHLVAQPLHLPHYHPEAQLEAFQMNWNMAVEQDGIDRKPAHLAFHLGYLIRRAEVRRAGRQAALISLRPLADHYLRRLVAL